MRTHVIILELTSQTAAQHRKCLGTEILAQLEELKESQAIALIIVGQIAIREGILPTVLIQGAVLNGSYRILPVIAGIQIRTLYNTSTRKAENAGL